MSYFIFNDIRSDDMSVIIERLPPIIKAPQKYNLVEVDNYPKSEIEELGYRAYEMPIPIGFDGSKLENIYNWLQGSGKLVRSDEPNKYYDANILEQIEYERAIRFRKAIITFMVQPYKHMLHEGITESLTVVNHGNVASLPKITVYGSGEAYLYINGIRVCDLTIDEYMTIDSEIQEAYKGDLSNLKNRSMVGDFPEFKVGINTISYTGNITKVETLARSRWL